MSNSGLQDGREPISAAVCGDLFQGPQATQTLTPWRACPALRRVFAPGHSLQAGQAPWSCSLASQAVLQCQLHKDKWDGRAGVHRPTKRNSGVGHDCAQASSDPSVSDPEPTPPTTTPATGCFLTRTLRPHPLCELRPRPAVCPSGSWHTPKTRAALSAPRLWGGNR